MQTSPLLAAVACALLLCAGCRSFSNPFARKSSDSRAHFAGESLEMTGAGEPLPGSSLEGLTEEPTGWDKLKPTNVNKSMKKAIGLGPDRALADTHFRKGDELFRKAQYEDASKEFKKAVNRWPDSGLEERSLYMLGESYFFADKYRPALDSYEELLKKYPSTQHSDLVIARQFSIARYWWQHNQAEPHWPTTPNFWDKTRPLFDTPGHALKAYNQIWLNDPRSPLADDAIMATANAHFLKSRYEDADYHYAMLRKDYTQSEHLIQAYLLGLQCQLRLYQGADYDGTPLDGAEELIDQMLVQFPTELGDERDRLLLAKKEVHAQRAMRDFVMAERYERNNHFGAARFYYTAVARNYPNSSFADQSKARLAQIQAEPDQRPDRFAFLDTIFDDSKRKDAELARQGLLPSHNQPPADDKVLR